VALEACYDQPAGGVAFDDGRNKPTVVALSQPAAPKKPVGRQLLVGKEGGSRSSPAGKFHVSAAGPRPRAPAVRGFTSTNSFVASVTGPTRTGPFFLRSPSNEGVKKPRQLPAFQARTRWKSNSSAVALAARPPECRSAVQCSRDCYPTGVPFSGAGPQR